MVVKAHGRRCNDRRGLTLMEVLVVVAILVVLAGVSSIFVFRYLDDAKKDRCHSDLHTLSEACKTYKIRYEEYPATLQQLLQPPSGKPFIESLESLNDPWGHQY